MDKIIKLDASVLAAAVVGKKEYEGPLGEQFDHHDTSDRFGQSTWERAEGEMHRLALTMALKKGNLAPADVDALFAGDLLNQCVGSAYGLRGCMIPYFGLYGACSTSAEGLLLAGLAVTHGVFDRAAVVTGSHNCSAERQYRTPIEYGAQRAPTAQWTVTGSGAFILGPSEAEKVRLTAALPGRVIDKGINDAANMGAAMAPALCDTLTRFFRLSNTAPSDYDLILTGDLGHEGGSILCDLMHIEGFEIAKNYTDCGILIYDKETQDTHAGGSGCGCSATVLASHILPAMEQGRYKKVLFIASGAMMSPDMLKQGETIPAIGHLVVLEGERQGVCPCTPPKELLKKFLWKPQNFQKRNLLWKHLQNSFGPLLSAESSAPSRKY